MRRVGRAVIVAPAGGGGKHVFRKEAARLQALYDIPDDRVVLFDHDAEPVRRFAFTCSALTRIALSLAPGETIDSVIVLRHGWPRGGQEGSSTANLHDLVDAFRGRLSRACTWALLSCSNAATIGRHPDGDMSFADTLRDTLCSRGYVDCQTYGHLIAGHATLLIADRQGGTWRPLARWFRGEGRPEGGVGGEPVLPRGHELLDDLYRLMRRSVEIDLDDDGEDDDMIGFRFLVPWMESQSELETWVRRWADVRTEASAETAPSVTDLQRALSRGGHMALPAPDDGFGTYGPRTRAAVRAFQSAHGLAADGIAGPLTWRALRAAGLLA